jgi:thiol-disulfide isomerase/thioredoxin
MSDESEELLRTHAAELASLPGDDPLRALLDVDDGVADESGERLRIALFDVEVPELAARLLAIPRAPTRRRVLPWISAAAAVVLAFVLGAVLGHPDAPSAPSPATEVAAPPQPPSTLTDATPVQGPRVLAVKFWHEHCPACKELDPSYADVVTRFDESEVLFVTFDMSTTLSRNQAALLASTLGLRDVYDEVFGSSGFVMLIDAQSKRRLGNLSAGQAREEMTASIREALARTRS